MLISRLRVSTQRVSRAVRPDHSYSASCISLKRYQSSQTQQKPYYVTTPIFYVNAAPHVGHLYTLVLSDILKRWQVLKGRKSILCTGTDEHGMKIQRAAEAAEIDTKDFCDQNASTFQQLANAVNVSYDRFIRTTDSDHKAAVQHFWMLLQERGYIYESKHEGWYSISDETFYPATAVTRALNPSTGKVFMSSVETGKEVEWTSEINYHFRLSAFQDKLLQFYKENPNFIKPEFRMTQIVKSVKAGLSDLSISRPSNRLTWGIRVPDDATQTIYVWLDALINYITMTGWPSQAPGTVSSWPADVQVIGKDIMRFHCIYWPAFLMALDIPPPKQILTHAHWTLGRQKMAKSSGNGVNPFFAMDRFGLDPIRFYMAYDGGIEDDADYDNDFITARYKRCLYGGIGGLASRILRSKSWKARQAIETMTGKSPSDLDIALQVGEFAAMTAAHRLLLNNIAERASRSFDDLNSGLALRMITEVALQTNAYIAQTEPWKLYKTHPEESTKIVFVSAESLRICAILLQPFMPTKMRELLDMLGVAPERRMFSDAVFGADKDYGMPLPGVKVKSGMVAGVLFPPLDLNWDPDKPDILPQLRGIKSI